jgi:hypothetical protein
MRSASGYFLDYPALKEGEFLQSILSCASTRLQSLTRVTLPHVVLHFSKCGIPVSLMRTEAHIRATLALISCSRQLVHQDRGPDYRVDIMATTS